jgi:putative ABC transport system substrate-binding protein
MFSGDAALAFTTAFVAGLNQAGFAEGRNVLIEFYHEGPQLHLLSDAANELSRRPVSLIVALGTISALAAKSTTTKIPVVFVTGDDPVARGLVATLNRPGGNVTGVAFASAALGAKRLQLLRLLAPNATLIGVLADAESPESQSQSRDQQEAARIIGQQLIVFDAKTDDDIDQAFEGFAARRVGALSIAGGPFLASRRGRLVGLAARLAIPAMYSLRQFVEDGGLISYGANLADAMMQTGLYSGRILRGEKPSEIPVLQPTRFELVINVKTAKTLGIDLPPALLALADEVIE